MQKTILRVTYQIGNSESVVVVEQHDLLPLMKARHTEMPTLQPVIAIGSPGNLLAKSGGESSRDRNGSVWVYYTMKTIEAWTQKGADMDIQNLVAIYVHTHLDTPRSLPADAAKASQEDA